MTHPLGSPFVRDQLSLRTLPANDRAVCAQRAFVLYWMQSTQRLEDNWALRHAIVEADRINKPLLILHTLDSGQDYASARFHTFVLQGAAELADRAVAAGLTYRFALCRGGQHCVTLVERIAAHAALVVTDLFPTEGVATRTARLALRLDCRLLTVDSVGVVPSASFPREEYSARTMRPKLAPLLGHAAEPVADRAPRRPFADALFESLPLPSVDPRTVDVRSLVRSCNVNHDVAAVPARGGLAAARTRLVEFVAHGLVDYRSRRSHPSDAGGTSRLSPYLHYGMISPLEVLAAVRAAAPAAEREAFEEEMVTWRELSLNFCLRNPDHLSLACAPTWAQRSMAAHGQDDRAVTHTLDTLECADTDDALWNAGQRELMETGMMHPVVRMLWGKAVVGWARSYDEAFTWLLYLNDKYSLDGRDPASVAGVQWCFGKFDRPFTTRPVWGTIRPMSLARALLKYDVDDYIARWRPAPARRIAQVA
ncbi:MAG: deoxyribodipyrimidine photo-lyase [bacterium]